MGKTRLNKPEQLPPSFDLAKYDDCSGYSIRDWLPNLEMRALGAFQLRLEKRYQGQEHSVTAAEFVDRLLEHPLWPSSLKLSATGLTKHFETSSVQDLHVWHYFMAEFDLQDARYAPQVKAFRKFTSEPSTKLTQKQRKLIDMPVWVMEHEAGIDSSGEAMVRVNLDCTEDKAVEDFRTWFRSTKLAQNRVLRIKRISHSESADWARHRILPYLDLYLWSLAAGIEITNQLYGITLFPDEYHITLSERIRKVIHPLALTLLSEEFCDTLRAQVVGDLSEAEQKELNLLPDKYSFVRATEGGFLPFDPDGKERN